MVIVLEFNIIVEHIYGGIASQSATNTNPSSLAPSRSTTPHANIMGEDVTSPGVKRHASVMAAASLQANSSSASSTPSASGSAGFQYEMRADGTVVRLRCPACGLERAKSRLGFYNHCRLSCKLIFADTDDRLLRCGLPVDPDEVPPDYFTRHPSVLRQEMNLAQLRAEVKGPQIDPAKRARVKVYAVDEPVDIMAEHSGHPLHFRTVEGGDLGETSHSPRHSGKGNRSTIIIPTSLANAVADVNSLESRFYIRRRLVVGNEARLLREEEKVDLPLIDGQKPTHEWQLYIRPWVPPGRKESAMEVACQEFRRLIRSITIHLHGSYAPDNVVASAEIPREIRRFGWGEFPVRIGIQFWDEKRNKSVEHVHHLRLSHVHGHGGMQPGAEHVFDLDLDRQTDMNLATGLAMLDGAEAGLKPEGFLNDDDALAIASRHFPLFGPPPPNLSGPGNKATAVSFILPYNRVASISEWSKLPASDRLCLEHERAVALHQHLQQTQPGWSLSVDDVARWCRERGLTPATNVPTPPPSSAMQPEDESRSQTPISVMALSRCKDLVALKYCRYCGIAHYPQDRFDLLQKNCSLKPRKLHLSSRTSAKDLLGAFNITSHPQHLHSEMPSSLGDLEPLLEHFDAAARDEDYQDQHRWLAAKICELDLPMIQPLLSYSVVEASPLPTPLPPRSISVLGEVFPLPRLSTCVAMEAAARCFLAELMQRAAKRIPGGLEHAVGRPTLITPLHVYLAAMGSPSANVPPTDRVPDEDGRFDFLTNSHMSGT